MTTARQARWLLDQLDELVDEGVLTAETAAALERRYREAAASGRNWTLTLLAALGGVLVGGGIILLLAHNWTELSRSARTGVALLPLVAGQALAGWMIWREQRSGAWREGVGAFLFLAVGASIALVAQTYHLPGDPASFLLTWMLLGLPVVYLLGSNLACLFYLAGIAAWATAPQAQANLLWFWMLLALVLPHLARLVRERGSRAWEWTLTLAALLSAASAVPSVLLEDQPFSEPGLWLYSGMAALALVVGCGLGTGAAWRDALRYSGAIGVASVSLYALFEEVWRNLDDRSVPDWPPAGFDRWLALALLAALPIAATALLVRRWRSLGWGARLGGALPLAVATGYLGSLASGTSLPGFLTLNLYTLGLGLTAALEGASRGRTRTATAGVALLAALVAIRFFDSELSFLWRGVGFVVAGALFLVTNLVLARRARRAG